MLSFTYNPLMLSVTYKPLMLSVVMLTVVLMSVVAPSNKAKVYPSEALFGAHTSNIGLGRKLIF